MTTPLKKSVRRSVADAALRRNLIVTLIPVDGDALVEVREHGRRSGYAIGLNRLFMMLAARAADAALDAKRRRRKKGGAK